MPKPRKEVMGMKFGRLTVTGEAPYKNKSRRVIALCECGHSIEVGVANLISGNTTSCGCYWKSRVITHGKSQTSLYQVWRGMLDRCNNPDHVAFNRYGGRGIQVTPEWEDLDNFIAWAERSGHQPGLTLDRRDNGLGYSPDNCHWVSRTYQQRNRRSHRGSSSSYVGVAFYKATGRWKAHLRHDGKLKHLGYHDTELEAAIARDAYIRDQELTGFTMNGVL